MEACGINGTVIVILVVMINTLLLKIQTHFFKKPKFKEWTLLEDLKYDFIKAAEDSALNLSEVLFAYLSAAFYFKVDYSKVYWKDTLLSFYKIHGVTSTIRKIPLTSNQSQTKTDKDIWDYSGRLWYLYSNLIASSYGWSQEQIAKLDVDDALAYLQEILTDRQLEKEFTWQTSEVAYPYDKTTKKSKFSPLSRPYWMVKDVVQRKAPPIPKALLPVGNIVRLHET
jgi:hypothetical protein